MNAKIINPKINIRMSIWAQPMPPTIAPPIAPEPRSPSSELKKPTTAPITIAIIRTVNHIIYSIMANQSPEVSG